MKVISIINLKGGVGKTISAINIAYILAALHGKKVLLIDNDKQGNTSKFFDLHDYDQPSISEVLTIRDFPLSDAVRATEFDGLDVLPANMNLLRANKEVLMDVSRPQQTRLSKALRVHGGYDFVVIDNAPDLDMGVINGLVACNDVLIPVKVDKFAFDGLDILREQIDYVREFNDNIRIAGCFVTMFGRSKVNAQGVEYLSEETDLPMFKTVIRKTVTVDETTFEGKPLQVYAKKSTAAEDYAALVEEYLDR